MIATKKYVDETLRKHNLAASKALGQNFLVEEDIAKDIVSSANINDETCVIEIGPGLGALTEHLLEISKLVKAYEIDANMVAILNETFKNKENFKLTNIDFLKVDLDALISEIKSEGFKRIIIISNLPYYITSKLLNKILVNNLEIDEIIAMMQKEVGQKIIRPDKKEYNLLSAILDYQYQVSVVKYVGKNSYLPRPEIDSVVLKFSKTEKKYDVGFESFSFVVSGLFTNRRKTVYNNLKNVFTDDKKITDCLSEIGIQTNFHTEQLTINDIVSIAKYYENNK